MQQHKCPPCHGNCSQGRECTACDPMRELDEADMRTVVLVIVGVALGGVLLLSVGIMLVTS